MSHLVDTHCHLHRAEFDPDREAILERARAAGVATLLDPATDLPSNRTVVALAKEHAEVYAAVGIHPHDAAQLTPEAMEELTRLAAEEKVVAIGEIGLDYYRDLSPREVQKSALRQMLGLARRLRKPVILHCREAARLRLEEAPLRGTSPDESFEEAAPRPSGQQLGEGQVYEELFSILRESLEVPVRGLLHCFAGTAEIADQALEMGLDISFAGNLTFPKADPLRSVAKRVPLDRILLETDAPFLAPQAYRGKRNEPAFLTELVNTWAQIRGLTTEELARATSENSRRLFGLPAGQTGIG